MKRLSAGLSRLLGLAACLVPSILLTWALTRGILRIWELPAPFVQLTGVCALWCCLFAVFFTNFKTVLAALVLLLAGAASIFFSGAYETLFALLAEPGPFFAVAISCPAALVTVALSRKRVMLPPLIILSGGAFLLLTVAGFAPGLTEAAAVCIALVAYTARSALHRWSGVISAASEGHLALWVLPAAAVLVVAAWALVAPATQLPKSEYLSQKLEYLNNYVMDLLGTAEPRTSFSLVPTGMQPDPQQLGGPVESREDEVLEVTTSDTRILLRGAVYADYNGHTWYNEAPVTRYRLSDTDTADVVFNNSLPLEGNLASRKISLSVTHLADGPSSLFVPFRVGELTPAEMMTLLVYFNDRGEVFSAQDIGAGVSYRMDVTLPTDDLEAIGQWMTEHADAQDTAYDTACADYLSLPESLPASVGELAAELTTESSNDAQAALALAQYLSANTTYSLEPVIPPANEDFVAHFLETKTGYCTYYASAMTVMARTLGIPARYVEGYQLPEDAEADEAATITQAQAHAWCEIYFKGIGWIPVDVSAQDGYSVPKEEEALPEEESEATEELTPEPTPTPSPKPEKTPESDKPQKSKRTFPWRPLLWSLLAVVVIAAALIGPPLLRHQAEKRACRTLPGAVTCQYKAILRLLAFVGLVPQTGETLSRFAVRVDELMPMRRTMADVAQVMMDLSYGPNPEPTLRQVEVLTHYRIRLDRAIRLGKGWWFYTLRETLRWKK